MSDREILEKAIQKAIGAGWKQPWVVGVYRGLNHDVVTGELFACWQYKDLMPFGYSVIGLIFNHDFAKALWGEEQARAGKFDEPVGVAWKYHLQQMVVSKDPIKYLGDNI